MNTYNYIIILADGRVNQVKITATDYMTAVDKKRELLKIYSDNGLMDKIFKDVLVPLNKTSYDKFTHSIDDILEKVKKEIKVEV